MKPLFMLCLCLSIQLGLQAQKADTSRINNAISPEQLLAPLRYLASDRLKGRHIGLPEIDTAARYIADQFKKAGAKPVPGATGYFQVFTYAFDRLSRNFRYDPQSEVDMPLRAFTTGLILKNVISFVQGTDASLRNQYIVLSSHYDHEGVADTAVMEEGKMDSIYNGARDNATGTAAVIAAAKYFARYPPKRSVLFICYTAEEEGLIGSNHYANHPLIPLNHTVFNLDIDNASYNTTRAVCLFGLDRTSEDSLINKAANAYRLSVLGEPGEDLRLFYRSDNYSLAQKGIPAPTYSLGMTDWNETITNRYHRLSDEVGNMDLDYIVKFIRSYILAAQYIANDPVQPRWTRDDPFEKDWKALFAPAAAIK
jgi:hypothetical protein